MRTRADIENFAGWSALLSAVANHCTSSEKRKTYHKMNRTLAFVSVAAAGVLAYAAYFDYNRRSSPEFRKNLKKRQVKQQKSAAKQQEELRKSLMLTVKKALTEDLAANPIPTDLSKKEEFFMEQVATGEQLANNPTTKVDAALRFYKALAVYPNPTDIMGIYQKTVPEDVYELLVMMIAIQPPATITNIIGGAAGVSGAAAAAEAAAAAVADEETKPSEVDLD
ncbi:MAS20-domain-containing protein [Metschnikowia bicuspidata var. bicuspidata NRRL YB-4993]|uniref:Mitochondrial import receptor subunit TOM20 n=1 Tax=Metschnikowia bicuspidata var. bicuspidata NRRL YB-4993 TaxID=869754 RepID=A0A1A0HI29_9ASCO|nr:MAS20-domain-containing protein [Metschnikowia bicuspidata var. bicuspidata NRRL YB-4993]OBA23819.1 MAS20-domain-containing protein [Metschnikowia bicuspidata var. bicuspidata NRRL YB-4993]